MNSFYLRVWYGLNIEPFPNMYNMLKKYRNRDIGEKEGNETLIVMGTGSYLKKNNSIIHFIMQIY